MTNEDLATRIQAGEDALTFQLWEQCKGFICKQAYRWAKAWKDRADFDVDDLIQAGYFALCDAVSSFQAERGSFITLLDMSASKHMSSRSFRKTAICWIPSIIKGFVIAGSALYMLCKRSMNIKKLFMTCWQHRNLRMLTASLSRLKLI